MTIRCNSIDIDSILPDLPITHAHFPLKYLGLPLSPNRLRKLDFQPWSTKQHASCPRGTEETLLKLAESASPSQCCPHNRFTPWSSSNPRKKPCMRSTNYNEDSFGQATRWSRAENVRSTGLRRPFPRSLAAWGSSTWKSLQDPRGCAGCGRSGFPQGKLGSVQRSPAMALTGYFSRTARLSPWGVAWGPASGFQGGFKDEGRSPKDIAPLLFDKTRKKKRFVADALHDNNWIIDLNLRVGFTTAHLCEFITLWNLVQATEL
jgi:hypothetical protein